MNAKKCIFYLMITVLLFAGSAASYGKTTAGKADEDFQTFLTKFTSSAEFQYSRIRFPLESPITLLSTDEKEEKTFPFTKEKWPLLAKEVFTVERVVLEEGPVYFSKFSVDEPQHKEFEMGYEDSDLDLRVVFDLIDGKWYVTDCYNSWYSFDLAIEELDTTIEEVQAENKVFMEEHP